MLYEGQRIQTAGAYTERVLTQACSSLPRAILPRAISPSLQQCMQLWASQLHTLTAASRDNQVCINWPKMAKGRLIIHSSEFGFTKGLIIAAWK